MYVCLCKGVTDHQISEAVDEGACQVAQLADSLNLGTGCGRCRETAQQIIDEKLADSASFYAA